MQVSTVETLANIANMHDDPTSNMRRISEAENAWIAAWHAQFDRLDAEDLQVKFGDLLHQIIPDHVHTGAPIHMLRYPIHTGEHDFSHLSPVHVYFDRPVRLTFHKEPTFTKGYLAQEESDDDSDGMCSVDSDEDGHSDAASDVTMNPEEEYYAEKHRIPTEIPVDDSECNVNNEPIEYIFNVQCQKPAVGVRTTEAQRQCMRGADFQHFLQLVRLAVAAHRMPLMLSTPHNNAPQCTMLGVMFKGLLARIAEMQEIRPYIIDLSNEYIGEYIVHCKRNKFQASPYFTQTSLAVVPEDIRGMAPYVTYLCVGSSTMRNLPPWMHEFQRLAIFDLRGTNRLYSYPRITERFNFVMQTLPASLWQLHTLQHMSLRNFSAIPSITHDLRAMTALKTLRLYNMFQKSTSILPLALTTLPGLETLRVCWCLHTKTPAWFSDAAVSLPRLLELHIGNNQTIQRIPQDLAVFPSLLRLKFENMYRLTRLPSLSGLQHLQSLSLKNLAALGWSIFDVRSRSPHRAYSHNAVFAGLHILQSLELCEMPRFSTLPTSMTDLHALQILRIECTPVSVDNWMPALSNLTTLHFNNVSNILRLPPGITCLQALKNVHLQELDILELPVDFGALAHVTTLALNLLPNLQALPDDIGSMPALQTLSIHGCPSLLELPEQFALLTSMRSLEITDCDQLLRHNTKTLQYVTRFTTLTALRIGPSEQADFPLELRRLVHMQKMCVCLAHAMISAPPDPALFRKLTVIVSCMPLLRHLQITHVREGPGRAPVTNGNHVSSVIHSLRAYPLQFLTELRLDQIYTTMSHWSLNLPTNLCTYALSEHNYDFPAGATSWKQDDFRAHWLLCQEKMRVFMEVFHPRLGMHAQASVCDPAICLKLVAGHVMYRNEFDDFVQEFVHM
jgi:hypothetical protein